MYSTKCELDHAQYKVWTWLCTVQSVDLIMHSTKCGLDHAQHSVCWPPPSIMHIGSLRGHPIFWRCLWLLSLVWPCFVAIFAVWFSFNFIMAVQRYVSMLFIHHIHDIASSYGLSVCSWKVAGHPSMMNYFTFVWHLVEFHQSSWSASAWLWFISMSTILMVKMSDAMQKCSALIRNIWCCKKKTFREHCLS